jgi:uncharacterized membrane protein YjjP (DUF1212 family)
MKNKSQKIKQKEYKPRPLQEVEEKEGFKIMRNTENAIALILFCGFLGFGIIYIFNKDYGFLGAFIGGLIGYYLSQRRR